MDKHFKLLKDTAIGEIQSSVPNSPRRLSNRLTAAVLNKSPIKQTRNGSMFSINITDKEQASSIRVVCFEEDLFEKVEATKTYDFGSFKVQKSFMNKTSAELILDHESKIVLASSQIQIESRQYDIAQILRGKSN